MRRTLDPKNDLVFHQLFAHPRSKRCLIALLTAVLRPRTPITDVTVLNPEIPLEQITNKGIVLDILVRLADGSLVDVEMQVQRRPGFPKRIIFYWARTYVSQLDRGVEYAELLPASVVVFTNFDETESASRPLRSIPVYAEGIGCLEVYMMLCMQNFDGGHRRACILPIRMSRSTSAVSTLRDLLAKGYTGPEARYMLMATHYRQPIRFSWETMEGTRAALRRLDNAVAALRSCHQHKGSDLWARWPTWRPASGPPWTTT